jgi:hypothetical protein
MQAMVREKLHVPLKQTALQPMVKKQKQRCKNKNANLEGDRFPLSISTML